MGALRRLIQRDPSGIATVVNLVAAAVAAAVGRPEFAPVFVAVAGLILGVRTQVTPVAKAAEERNQALTTVALDVARNLTDGTAGAPGQINAVAAGVVDSALERVKSRTSGHP